MAKFLKLLIAIPVAVLIVAFAIANRQVVAISFDPFHDPTASSAIMTAPLFILLFMVLLVGAVAGGIATWFSQGGLRRRARKSRDEAERWRDEVRRLREQPPIVVPSPSPSRHLARLDG